MPFPGNGRKACVARVRRKKWQIPDGIDRNHFRGPPESHRSRCGGIKLFGTTYRSSNQGISVVLRQKSFRRALSTRCVLMSWPHELSCDRTAGDAFFNPGCRSVKLMNSGDPHPALRRPNPRVRTSLATAKALCASHRNGRLDFT